MMFQQRGGILFRFHVWRSIPSCRRCLQTTSVNVSGKLRTESVLKNSHRENVFPVQEAVLNQIRHDILLQETYKGRVVDETNVCDKLSKDKLDILKQSVSLVKQHVNNLTQQELIHFLKALAHMKLSRVKLVTDSSILQIIEDECCFRASNMDSAEMLLVADAFFMLHYRCSRYFSAMFREFEHRWTSLSMHKEDVVQLAMCIVMSRKFPLFLVRNFEKFLISRMEEFSACELSVICSAFFVTNTSFKDVDVMDKLASAVLCCIPNGELTIYQLGSILKALRHAYFTKPSFYDKLGNLVSSSPSLLNGAKLADLSNIVFTYASLRISHPVLFARILSNAITLVQDRTHMRVKDVGRLVWSFAMLQEPLNEIVQNQLLFLLRRDVHLMEEFSEAFVESLLSLAMQKIYPVDLMRHLFLTNVPKQKHVADFRLQLIDSSARIECPDYAGQVQKPDVRTMKDVHKLKIEMHARQGLLSVVKALYQILGDPAYVWCHHVLPHTKITDVELRLDAYGRPVEFNSKLSDVDVINNVRLTDCRFTPSYSENSITSQLLAESSSTYAARIDSGFIHLQPDASNGSQRRVILKVMGWNQYIVNKPTLTGIHQLELRLLAKMGYEILVISASQAQQLDVLSPSQRVDFVRDVLVKQLNIDISPFSTT